MLRFFCTKADSPPVHSFIQLIAAASLLYRMCPPATSYVNPSTVFERHSPPTSSEASNRWTSSIGNPPSTR